MYRVILDERKSYIEPVENGIPFENAVEHIIEYARECSYDLQEAFWSVILTEGEAKYQSCPVRLS